MKPAGFDDNGSPQRVPGSFAEWFHPWRYLFWLLGLVGLVALFYFEENWRSYRAWGKYKQQEIARGEHFEAADFIPPRVADAENFAMSPAISPFNNFVPSTQRSRDDNAPPQLFQSLLANYDAASKLVKSTSGVRPNSWIRGRTELGLWQAAFSQGT